jgi:2Fe-2S ferredoxin
MPIVRVEPLGLQLEVSAGETLFDAACRSGIDWPTSCYGQARCSLCHVVVLAGGEHLSVMQEPERTMVDRLRRFRYRDRDLDVRLACQLTLSGDATVRQPSR